MSANVPTPMPTSVPTERPGEAVLVLVLVLNADVGVVGELIIVIGVLVTELKVVDAGVEAGPVEFATPEVVVTVKAFVASH